AAGWGDLGPHHGAAVPGDRPARSGAVRGRLVVPARGGDGGEAQPALALPHRGGAHHRSTAPLRGGREPREHRRHLFDQPSPLGDEVAEQAGRLRHPPDGVDDAHGRRRGGRARKHPQPGARHGAVPRAAGAARVDPDHARGHPHAGRPPGPVPGRRLPAGGGDEVPGAPHRGGGSQPRPRQGKLGDEPRPRRGARPPPRGDGRAHPGGRARAAGKGARDDRLGARRAAPGAGPPEPRCSTSGGFRGCGAGNAWV
ncbi:MAG: Acyl-CoA:1-acyl-sn-glycerol-3-phosphate acyltransferase, partial [uncultured Gemmatimonadetes bacterium]